MKSRGSSQKPGTTEGCEGLARLCLLGLVAAIPILFTQSTTSMFDLPKFSLLCFGTALGIGIGEVWRRREPVRVPRSPALVLAAVLLALTTISAVASPYKPIAILGLYNRYGGLVSHLAFFLVFVLVLRLQATGAGVVDGIARAIGIAAGVVTAYTVIQAAGLDWFEWESLGESPFDRPFGNLGNPTFTGAFLAVALPLCIYLAVTEGSRRGRASWMAVAILSCLAIYETRTRSGIVAALVATATVSLAFRKQLSASWKKTGAAARGVVMAVVAAGAFLVTAQIVRSLSEGAHSSFLFDSGSFYDRINYWRAAVAVILDHPLLGTGPNTFYLAYLPYRRFLPPDQRDLLTLDAPHNIFLERAATTGLPALAVYLALLGTVLLLAYRRARLEAGRERLRIFAFAGLVVGYGAQGLFSLDVSALSFVGWVGVASLAALTQPPAASPAGAFPVGPGLNARTTFVFGVVLVLAAVGIRTFAADAKFRLALDSTDNAALEHVTNAIALNPFEGGYELGRALLLTRRGLALSGDVDAAEAALRSADAAFKRAQKLRPRHALSMRNFAQAKTMVANATKDVTLFASAEEIWAELERFDPLNYLAWFERSENFRQWARATGEPSARRRQIEALERSIALNPTQERAWVRLAAAYRALGEPEKADEVLLSYFGEVLTDDEMDEVVQAVPPALARPSYSRPLRPLVLGLAAALAAISWLVSRIDLGFGVEAKPKPKDRRHRRTRTFHHHLLALGAVAIGMVAPYSAPLWGIPPSAGEIRELFGHLVGGALILGLGLGWGSREGRPDYPLLVLAGAWILVLHWGTPLFDRGHPAWSRAAAHLAPGIIALLWAAQHRLYASRPRIR